MTTRFNLFTFFLIIAASASLVAQEPRVGDKVAAKFNGLSYYIATVTGAAGGQFDVLYGDGTKGKVVAADIIKIVPGTNFKVGDHVLAVWKLSSMYPGTVTALTSTTINVKWDDGDTPLDVPRNQAVPFSGHRAPAAVASLPGRGPAQGFVGGPSPRNIPPYRGPALANGSSVAAYWNRISWYIATIDRVNARRGYHVKYGDGDSGTVSIGDAYPINATAPIAEGTRVLACAKGPIMMPGTITARNGDTYTVKWEGDNGSEQVPRAKIAPLTAP